jgi:hypothetical protein
MAIDFVTGYSAETGGILELASAVNYPQALAAPAPPHANETYCYGHVWKATAICPLFTWNADDWYTIIVDVRFDDATPTNAIEFLNIEEGAPNFLVCDLTLNTSGQIELRDANGNLIGTSGFGLFTTDVWAKVAVKLKHTGTTDLMVWVDDALIFDKSNFDATNGSTVGTIYTYNSSASILDGLYTSHLIVLKDDGATITTNTPHLDTYYCRMYCNTTQDGTPDSGDALDGATEWNDAGDVPSADGNYARYDVDPFGDAAKDGEVNCDDGDYTGPAGDAAIGALDEVLGAIYTARARSYQGAPSGRKVDFRHRWGSSTSGSFTQYNNLGASFVNKHEILQGSDAHCPLTSEYARHGAGATAGTLAGRLYCAELYTVMYFREIPVDAGVGVVHAGMIDA